MQRHRRGRLRRRQRPRPHAAAQPRAGGGQDQRPRRMNGQRQKERERDRKLLRRNFFKNLFAAFFNFVISMELQIEPSPGFCCLSAVPRTLG